VNGQGEFAEQRGGFPIRNCCFETLPHSPEPQAQRHVFIVVTQLAQETADVFCALTRRADDSQRRIPLRAAGRDMFQQQTFKLAAILRTIGVNPAAAAVERVARLEKLFIFAGRSLTARDPQAERSQPRDVVAGMQLSIGKNHAIAAQAAREAERI
jgi:hypothetical protein